MTKCGAGPACGEHGRTRVLSLLSLPALDDSRHASSANRPGYNPTAQSLYEKWHVKHCVIRDQHDAHKHHSCASASRKPIDTGMILLNN